MRGDEEKALPHSSIIIFKVFCDESRPGRRGGTGKLGEGRENGGWLVMMRERGAAACRGSEMVGIRTLMCVCVAVIKVPRRAVCAGRCEEKGLVHLSRLHLLV